MITEIRTLINWIIWLARHPQENTSVSLWTKGISIYVNGELVLKSNNKKWVNVVIVNEPYNID